MRFAVLLLLVAAPFLGCGDLSNPFSPEEDSDPAVVDIQPTTGPEIHFNDGPGVFIPNVSNQGNQQVVHSNPIPDQHDDADDAVPSPDEILPPGLGGADPIIPDAVASNQTGQDDSDLGNNGTPDSEVVVHHNPIAADPPDQSDDDLWADDNDSNEGDDNDLWADEVVGEPDHVEPDTDQNNPDEDLDTANPDDEDDLWADEIEE